MSGLRAAAVLIAAAATLRGVEFTTYSSPYPELGTIERQAPAADRLLSSDARMEKLVDGLSWTEGPEWLPQERALLFSDMGHDRIIRWEEGEGAEVYLQPSGYTGAGPRGGQIGSNGLLLDGHGRLLLCQHGDRRIARYDPETDSFTTIVDRYEGKHLNSPNDLALDTSGNLYFTDPPYGLGPGADAELDFSGVYRVTPHREVSLLTRQFSRPNGIALSPDEQTLYVSNSEGDRIGVWAFPLKDDGSLGEGRQLFDAEPFAADRPGVSDGMAVDVEGNIWATGPGGVYVISPAGEHLATLLTGRPTANCTFGGADGRTLFITANQTLIRLRTGVRGLER